MNVKEVENYFNAQKKKHLTKDFREWWDTVLTPAVELFGLIDIVNRQKTLECIAKALDPAVKDHDREEWIDKAIGRMKTLEKMKLLKKQLLRF